MIFSNPLNWRRLLKIVGISVVMILGLFVAASWILFRQRNALVLEQIQSALNKSQSGQLTIGAIDLRFLRSFPDISIEVDSIYYYERHDSLRNFDEQPILHADRIFIALELWSLFNNRVAVSEISISGGRLNLVEYTPGVYNIHRALEKPGKVPLPKTITPGTSPKVSPQKKPTTPATKPKAPPKEDLLTLALDNITINDLALSWLPLGAQESNSLLVRELDADLSMEGTDLEIALSSRYRIDTVVAGSISLPQGDVRLDAEGNFDFQTKHLAISNIDLLLDVFSFKASGTYEHGNNGMLDLQVKATSNDLPVLEKMLRQDIIRNNRDLLRSGDFYIDGRFWGPLKQLSPRFDFRFGMKDLSFRLPGHTGSFQGLGFEGSLSSGDAQDYSGAVLYLKQIKGQVPGGAVDGDIRISNFVAPWLHCTLQTQFALDGYDKIFRINSLKELQGSVGLRLRFDGPMRLPQVGDKGPKARFDGDFSLSKVSFLVSGSTRRFGELNTQGSFTSGARPDQSEAVLQITTLEAMIPGGKVHGNLRISNLNQPLLHYRLSAVADLLGYDEALQLKKIRNLKGKVSANLRFDGPLAFLGTHAMDSSRSSELRFDSISFIHVRSKKTVTHLQASLVNQNNVADLSLDLQVGESDLHLKASIENLMHRIFSLERVVQATGKVTATQFQTRDFILDSLRTPIIKDRISDLALDFRLQNELAREDSLMEDLKFRFDIRNLTAGLEKLPDIRNLEAEGTLHRDDGKISLDLRQFHLTTPQGRADISGDVNIPGRRQLDARARIKLTQFPWAYVADLIAEIKNGAEPTFKNLPADVDVVSGDLDVSASLRTYPFDFHRLEVQNSRFVYVTADKRSFGVTRIDATLEPFSFNHPTGSGSITGLRNVQGTIALSGLKLPGLIDVNAALTVDGRQDSLSVAILRTSKAKQENGNISINMALAEPPLHFTYAVVGAPAEDIISKFSKKEFLKGTISYTIDLDTRGKTWADAKSNLIGKLEIQSDSLWLYGIDIDDALTKFEKSQKFNLADLGAVVLVGPVGIVATKGTDFVALANINVNNLQKTRIQQLLAQWKLDRQVLSTSDVAFATMKNRVAFSGAIDFARDSIPGVQVAVVDKNGCSLMDQKLHGKFSAIQTGKLNVAKTLLGSVINVVDALVGKDCTPVYKGQVKAPKAK